jgi:hypothetical protein
MDEYRKDTPVYIIDGISTRLRNVFDDNNVRTFEQIMLIKKNEFLTWRNAGENLLAELMEFKKSHSKIYERLCEEERVRMKICADWEQRRYELAKMLIHAIVTAPLADGVDPHVNIQSASKWAVEFADELIFELKRGSKK